MKNDRVRLITFHVSDAKELYTYKDYQALQTIGYREVFKYIDRKLSNTELINAIQQNTRRFAKKQINWFKNQKYIQVNVEDESKIEQIIKDQL